MLTKGQTKWQTRNSFGLSTKERTIGIPGEERSTLKGPDFSSHNFHLAHLSKVDLRGAILSDATFTDTDLDGADLSGAVLVQVKI